MSVGCVRVLQDATEILAHDCRGLVKWKQDAAGHLTASTHTLGRHLARKYSLRTNPIEGQVRVDEQVRAKVEHASRSKLPATLSSRIRFAVERSMSICDEASRVFCGP